ncbi:MAG: hypothetical protein Q8R92_18375 [Deltaproteobacteria bacterium]|nr:hypothetical protein [Deltaproteobacteria bacterium]
MIPPDPEPIYVGTSLCYAPGYTPPASYITDPGMAAWVLMIAVVLGTCFYFVGRDWMDRRRAR